MIALGAMAGHDDHRFTQRDPPDANIEKAPQTTAENERKYYKNTLRHQFPQGRAEYVVNIHLMFFLKLKLIVELWEEEKTFSGSVLFLVPNLSRRSPQSEDGTPSPFSKPFIGIYFLGNIPNFIIINIPHKLCFCQKRQNYRLPPVDTA